MKQRRWIVRESVIQVLRSPNKRESHRLPLCAALGFSELWVDRIIRANKVNGPLTSYASLSVLKELFKLESFQEILEEATEVELEEQK